MINLLPYTEKKYIHRIRTLRVVTVVSFAVLILLISAAVLLLPTLVSINSRFLLAEGQITHLQTSGVIIVPEVVDNANAEAQTMIVKFASPTGLSPVQYIAIAQKNILAGIVLTGFSFDPSSGSPVLTVDGVASTREALQRYVAALQSDVSISAVDSPIANYIKDQNAQFSVKVTFKK